MDSGRWELFYKNSFQYQSNWQFLLGKNRFRPAKVKFRIKHKYEKKLFVWIAISPRGISEPFIMASGKSVDQFIYRDNSLAPRLLPFIKKNHSDQACCHYAEHSLDFLCENLIHHATEVDNPANLPEVRPIEDCWSLLKSKVHENNWEAKTLHQFEVRSRDV